MYLTLITKYESIFGSRRQRLHEAFPKLFHRDNHIRDGHQVPEEKSLIHKVFHDEPILYEDELNVLKVFFLGIPQWREWEFSYLTIGLNVLLALLSLDLVLRAPVLHKETQLTFARLGFVDDRSAKILLRDPNPASLPIYSYIKADSERDWSSQATVYWVGEETDYTYPFEFADLLPHTTYEYYFSNTMNGTFTTAPLNDRSQSLTFVTTSCIKASFPYNPFSHSLAIHGFKHLSSVLKSISSRISFMLFLGDFIYVDVPYRLSWRTKHYREEYRRVYASPSWQLPGMRSLPWIHTMDDHEIANDWAGGNSTEPFPAASDPFMHYHASVNPPLPPSAFGVDNTTYYQFTQGPASFFMLDTRRYRTAPDPDAAGLFGSKVGYGSSSSAKAAREYGPSMLGPEQLESLLAYLRTTESTNVRFKIIASSVPFTKNWRFGFKDSWAGYPSERRRVLDAMYAAEQRLGIRVVILSGDRHEFGAVRFASPHTVDSSQTETDTGQASGPHEFSVSPLSMFYLPIRTFRQIDHEDVTLAYYPDGNSKFGVVRIAPVQDDSSSSVLTYTLYVDGKQKWQYNITSPDPTWQERGNMQSWKAWH